MDDCKSKIDKIQPQSLSALFNAIETSLKLKYKNVQTFDLRKEDKGKIFFKNTPVYEDGMYTFYKHVDTEHDNVTSEAIIELPTLLSSSIDVSLTEF